MAIHVLPPEEARKIAAGEVIDRPAALVREFLDNAIDAESGKIELFLEGGGVLRTEVVDDGAGMDKEDLEICCQTHATSKIRGIADLDTAETLGFRGEALAAAAAVSRLEILTSTGGAGAWLLQTGGGREDSTISPSRRTRGTTVRALGLFDTIPVRKRFLKREGAEGALCRQVFIDKALAFPLLDFRLTLDGKQDLLLPPAASYKERFILALLSRREGSFLHEISAEGQGFSAVIVIGGPELYRRDRRRLSVFANGRRINDYALLQALEYGVQGWFPNGVHPVGALFIDIDPSLADFNIHPAKRDVRFSDSGAIHHAVTTALRDFSRRVFGAVKPETSAAAYLGAVFESPASGEGGGQGAAVFRPSASPSPILAMEALLEHPPVFMPPPRGEASVNCGGEGLVSERQASYGEPDAAVRGADLRLVGRLFSLFILAEQGDKLFIIDQHAAHERILYNRFITGNIPRQELLVPIPFITGSGAEDRFLTDSREELAALGVLISADGADEGWRIEALPVNWRLSDRETIEEILALRDAGENMAERWAAGLCCREAVKDGDYLDNEASLALAKEALALPIPRCPHGRPVWKELSREELFRAVKRIK